MNRERERLDKIKDQIPLQHQMNRDDVDGYYKIPDWDKFEKWSLKLTEQGGGGNCFNTNWDLFIRLRDKIPGLKIYVMRYENGITHAFVVDGDIMFDNSQFRNIKMSLPYYLVGNKILGYSVYDGTDKEDWLNFCNQAVHGRLQRKGSLPIKKSSMYHSMKTIINL
jgi:hypothetical protein